jgi:tetratricopeptide (TPR) repeat protein
MNSQHWKDALLVLNQCLRLDPYYSEAYYSRGLAHERLRQWKEALTDYSVYLDRYPDHTEALFSRAKVRYQLALYEQAREDFKRLLYLPAGETNAVFFRTSGFGGQTDQIFTAQGAGKGYLFNYLGLVETKLQHLPAALAYFDSALNHSPGEADTWVNRGIVFQQLGKSTEAESDYAKALVINPYHALAKHNLSTLQGNSFAKKSAALLDSAIADNPSLPYAYAARAYAQLEKKDYQGAREDYTRAIRIDSSQADYFLNRGLANEKLQRTREAYKDYSHALLLDERFEKAWLNRGNLLMRMGELQEAIEDYSSAIVFNKNYASAYYNRALAYQRLGRNEEACRDAQKAETLGMQAAAKVRLKVCSNN